MKAITITEPGKIGIAEIEKPEPKEGEALLRVLYCGICGADVASFTGNQPFTTYPRIPGHEFSAQIVTVPENDRGLKSGDVVTCNPYFNCGSCYACRKGLVNACTDNQTMGVQRDGAFCEYITMPVERIIPGKGLNARQLALIEPFSISQHALSRCEVRKGDKLMIAGAGPIGLFALLAAKARGAEVTVTDVLDGRLEKAKAFGADYTVNAAAADAAEQMGTITEGRGFDVCVEACGRPETFLNCIEQAAQGANLILIGNGKAQTTFLHSIMLKKELNVFGSRNAYTGDFEKLIDMISSGTVDVLPMVSAVYEAADTAEAFNALTHNDGSLEKVLIRFADPE
uniref:Alcohol dehydrogenase n=1 Tax=uncultured bacterium Contigcl_1523 TaxID=1393648 RepID=W0FS65_9BACT|nr:alcohol dehydrogenase [uncultured bacterium Contigcl_1523]